ncbi:MAG: FAD-dependent oxidoreductase [Lachnospiraceae bacterium]|nr:FAD-dependent oxidoreductase [Lachnospiraceae bacterium]
MILREMIDGVAKTSIAEPVFEESYDLVVVGLGTAGAISLITAGREGLKVLGVEQLYGMGGTGTIGAICYYYFGAEGGLYKEMDEKEQELRKGTLFHGGSRRDTCALVMDREARECGAEVKYECIVTGVYMEANKVLGLRLFRNGKEMHVEAKKVIDATGEAIVCHIAGAEMISGRDFDGQTQPATSSSILIGEDGRCSATNKDAGFVKQHEPRDVSRVIINSNTFPMYLKENYSQEKQKYVAVAPLFGVREGRRIKGRKTLTLSNVVNKKERTKKPLFYAYSNVDNHGKDGTFENEELCDWMAASGLWGVLMSVPVPMETLLPEGLENIMVAGRCLSVDHNLAACVRMKRDMAKSGEAAAYICSEAIKKNISLSEVEYDTIIEKLKATKCLDEANNVGFMERVFGQYFGYELPELKTTEEILTWLAGEKPGWAIWACRAIALQAKEAECQPSESQASMAEKQRLVEALKENLNSENENLSRHCALALGIMGEQAAISMLRKMAMEPDNYVPKSSLKYIYTRGVSAIYLLGKLGDVDSIEMLFDIVERKGLTDIPDFTFGEFYNEATDVYSQYVLFASRALVEIAKKHPDKKKAITEKLIGLLDNPEYHIMITLRDNSASLHDLKPKMIDYINNMTK